MITVWLIFVITFLLAETVYHLGSFGPVGINPLYLIGLIFIWSGVFTFLVSLCKGKLQKVVYFALLSLIVLWNSAQIVYMHIFKQPLLWEAIFTGGGDALTNYYKEALLGIWQCLPRILLLMVPIIVTAVLLYLKKIKMPRIDSLSALRVGVICTIGLAIAIATMQVGRILETDYYEDYKEFYDPYMIAERMGVLPTLQRDTVLSISGLFGGDDLTAGQDSYVPPTNITEDFYATESTEPDDESQSESQEQEPPKPVYVPQQFELDLTALEEAATDKKTKWLAEYFRTEPATYTNEYTGLFEGYNLIFLTAEGFSSYAIHPELTPTLYRLANSGFVFNNYYVPLWQTSTSDGEYINVSGLIPDGQFSMRKSGANVMPFTLPAYFAKEGVNSYAYHNNSLSYYDRHVTHPNLGYYFRAAKLGSLEESEYGKDIFYMEHPKAWPASDLEMMTSSVPEYISLDRFHVYYMTISGHMNYNFAGNKMSAKNKDAVAHLEMSENAKAYIACHIELDKAMESLLNQLEAAGKLENTVICLSADHYPYGMTEEEYEELAGKSLATGQDKFRNTLILWNAAMEDEPVYVDKVCGSMDLLPTLLNLFGFEYDSRMYAGRDIFSDREGMVIFNDRSFVTDAVSYTKKTKETIWRTGENGGFLIPEDRQAEYLEAMQSEVKRRYNFSGYILQENYYEDILKALPEGTIAPAVPVDSVPYVYTPPVEEPEVPQSN